jgi:hypothetical protein
MSCIVRLPERGFHSRKSLATTAARTVKLLSIQQLRPLARSARKRGGAVLGRYAMMVQ